MLSDSAFRSPLFETHCFGIQQYQSLSDFRSEVLAFVNVQRYHLMDWMKLEVEVAVLLKWLHQHGSRAQDNV